MTLNRAQIIAIICLILWLVFTFGVNASWFDTFDLDTMQWVQSTFPRSVDIPFSLFSYLGSAELTTAIFLAIVFRLTPRPQRIFLFAMFVFMTGIELIGKTFVRHPGPSDDYFRLVTFLPIPSASLHTDFSYPSGHAARTIFLATILAGIIAASRLRRAIRISLYAFLIGFSAIMLLSRPYLGEHWTTDVLGGALLALATALPTLTPPRRQTETG